MYKISSRLLNKGEIINRDPNFYLFAYEYTLKLNDHKLLADAFTSWVNNSMKRIKGIKAKEDAPTIIALGTDWKFEIQQFFTDGVNSVYHVFFSRWQEIGLQLSSGDEMNKLITGLEQLLVRIDPLVWVRDMWLPRSVSDRIRSIETWTVKYPAYKMTPEEIRKKGYSNGRPFEENYLGDRLREYGLETHSGTPYANANGITALNPLVMKQKNEAVERLKKIREEEAAEAVKEPVKPKPKFCNQCGTQIPQGASFCPKCGAKVIKTLEEKRAEEHTLKEYPMFFITVGGERTDPYIYANLDNELKLVPEIMDNQIREYRLNGIKLLKSPEGSENFTEYHKDMSNDNYLYISDSRISVINRKYNKGDAGSWIGFGGIIEFAIGEALTATEHIIKAGQRSGKALAGHLRYEWISHIVYKEKKGTFDFDTVHIYFKDLKKTTWALTLYLKVKNLRAYDLADDILHKTVAHRLLMDDNKNEELTAFLNKYKDSSVHFPEIAENASYSILKFPVYYFATKGKPFSPWFY